MPTQQQARVLLAEDQPGRLELSQAIMELCIPGTTEDERAQQAVEMYEIMRRFNNQEKLSPAESRLFDEFLPRLYRAHHYGAIDGRRIEVTVTARLGDRVDS